MYIRTQNGLILICMNDQSNFVLMTEELVSATKAITRSAPLKKDSHTETLIT